MKLSAAEILAEKAEFVLQHAKTLGADQCAVRIEESLSHSVQFRHGELEELSHEQDIAVYLTAYRGTRKGTVSLSDWREEALKTAVAAALQSGDFTDPDPASGVADCEDLAEPTAEQIAALDVCHAPADIDTLKDFAARTEAAAFAADSRICNSEGAFAYSGLSQFWQASSNGFAFGFPHSSNGFYTVVLAQADGDQQSNSAYDGHCCIDDLRTPEAVGKEAAEKTCAMLNPRPIAAGEYPILFRPEVAAGLIRYLFGALDGVAQYRQLGFLPDCLGKPVLPAWLSLIEQPSLPRNYHSKPFDYAGIPVRQPTIVKDGVAERYLLSPYSARRLNMRPTGNTSGVSNLKLAAASEHCLPEAALLREMGRGVIVTSLMGQGVNSLTGDYSRGASGFWVENGEIVHPVEGITVASNLKDMLMQIVALGDNPELRSNLQAPSILLEKMTVAQ